MLNDYIQYFRQIAIQHKDIKHDPISEENDAVPGSCHFVTQTYMETLTGVSNKVGFPLLLVNLYATDTHAENEYDITETKQAAFTVLDAPEGKTTTDKNNVLAKTEKIVYDILQKIWDDHYGENAQRCKAPLTYFDFNTLQIDSVGPVQNGAYGWVVEFKAKPLSIKINQAPESGTFIE